MKHILLPTDFSETSINAMEYAVQLFMHDDCTFHVLNTYLPVYQYTPTVYESFGMAVYDLGEIYKTKSENGVHTVIESLSRKFPQEKHCYVGRSSFNTLFTEMESIIEEHDIECIIMGTNGASGLKEVFIGSQTMNVIKRSKIPVLGIPIGCIFIQLKDILFTTNYETGSDHKGLSFFRDLSSSHNSKLIFLHIQDTIIPLDDNQEQNKYELENFFKGEVQFNDFSAPMNVLEAIKTFESKHDIDLLVMVHNKHNFFENLLFSPVVQNIAFHSKVPFLILPPH